MQKRGRITVVGLGAGSVEQVTLGVWRRLKEAKHLYLRTAEHPVADELIAEHLSFESFDAAYEAHPDFTSVYREITDTLLSLAVAGNDVVYAVPGHPAVAEQTVVMLRQQSKEQDVLYEELGGESFLEQAFSTLQFDPVDGFQLFDAMSLPQGQFNVAIHSIITQVYDSFTASEVKLSLMNSYPDEYQVTVCHRLGFPDEVIEQVPLYELDRLDSYGNWSLVYVPAARDEALRNRSFERLHEIVHILRSPGGCPWDQEQTHESIRKNLIEEMYEVLEAIDTEDMDALCEELGDVLLQVMLHSQMEEETGLFTVYDVIQTLNEKLIRRHPHVFGDQKATDPDEALASWQSIKAEERKQKGEDDTERSALAGIPKDLPALMKAWELQKRAAKVGFDWPQIEDVFAKIDEELEELKVALDEGVKQSEEELGDVLFSVVNAARKLKIDPEYALAKTNQKFIDRFTYVETQLRIKGHDLENTSLLEMDRYWEEAKKN